jgi:hypothetical protein
MPASGLASQNTVTFPAAMHSKKRLGAPVPMEGLGLRIALAFGLNTDRSGAFSPDVARSARSLTRLVPENAVMRYRF